MVPETANSLATYFPNFTTYVNYGANILYVCVTVSRFLHRRSQIFSSVYCRVEYFVIQMPTSYRMPRLDSRWRCASVDPIFHAPFYCSIAKKIKFSVGSKEFSFFCSDFRHRVQFPKECPNLNLRFFNNCEQATFAKLQKNYRQ